MRTIRSFSLICCALITSQLNVEKATAFTGSHVPIRRLHDPTIHKGTQLNEKWGPRWNPTPDSEFFGGDDNKDIYGGRIHSGARRARQSRFVPTYGKDRFFSLQRVLVILNIACFLQQITSAITYLPKLNEVLEGTSFSFGELTKADIIEQFLLGAAPLEVEAKSIPSLGSWNQSKSWAQSLTVASSLGPFTMDFINQRLLTRIQPHRYLTSGFLHGGLLHLLFNMRYLWKLPRWVEDNGGSGNGLGGWFLYLTTYLSSIVMGNLTRDYFSSTGVGVRTLCLGASGGICGLNGLTFAMLTRMKNTQASTRILKDMAFLILFGQLMSGVSNASHIGGFLCGTAMGYLFGPTYSPGYSRWQLSRSDNEPSLEYRKTMGRGINPDQGSIPLRYLWGVLAMIFMLRQDLRAIPEILITGLRNPGQLSGMAM